MYYSLNNSHIHLPFIACLTISSLRQGTLNNKEKFKVLASVAVPLMKILQLGCRAFISDNNSSAIPHV